MSQQFKSEERSTEQISDKTDVYSGVFSNSSDRCTSPIDINVIRTKKLNMPKLIWNNYSVRPKKMKITNNGQTRNIKIKVF